MGEKDLRVVEYLRPRGDDAAGDRFRERRFWFVLGLMVYAGPLLFVTAGLFGMASAAGGMGRPLVGGFLLINFVAPLLGFVAAVVGIRRTPGRGVLWWVGAVVNGGIVGVILFVVVWVLIH